ncbi:lysophospholipid acyltransferase family protein [bacterium]|nr:lysophospholipid acyltransferase family protein [bacterium]
MKDFLEWIAYAFLKSVQFVCRLTPLPFRLYIGKFLGVLTYLFSIHRKALARANLSVILGEDKRCLALEVFKNLGMSLVEFITLPFLSPKDMKEFCLLQGRENLTEALSMGKGVILLTAHLGNWELIGARLALEGFNIISPARPQDKFEEKVRQIRNCKGYNTISVDNGIIPLIPCLKKGNIVAVLSDQNILIGGVNVPFFGIPVSTPPGAAILALRSGAPVLPAFDVRIGKRHLVYIGKPISLMKNGNFRENVIKNTAKFNEIIEGWVRKYPEQWLWLHHRWRKV